jgi:hypothetical protein
MSMIIDGTNGITFNNATTQNSGGKVLQVVTGSTSTAVGNSTSTWATTGLTASITPLFSTSKILVIVNMCGMAKNNTPSIGVRLVRGSTTISYFDPAAGYNNANTYLTVPSATTYLDSPATTSSTTYLTQYQSPYNQATVYAQDGSAISTITLMEIAQ